ncbi:magnesium transporter CorA family protein [Paenibacillus sp. CMAA1364]
MDNKQQHNHYCLTTFPCDWQWHDIVVDDWASPEIQKIRMDCPYTKEWLDILPELDSNYISVRFPDDSEDPSIFGTMVYCKDWSNTHKKRHVLRCHYFVYKKTLITINLDDETRETLNNKNRKTMLEQCQEPMEGVFVIEWTILHYLHQGMDRYESNLRKLEHQMEHNNHRYVMDEILTSRYELLFLSNLSISFQELISATHEGYHDKFKDNRFYNQLYYRVERMDHLVKHYNDEIDTLISIDNAVSSFRGNEIMKTLTILTAIFTPASVLGAIWGMNFDVIPFSEIPWGFVGMMGMIGLTSAIMYLWMYRKGWTGDLLRAKSKKGHLE